MVAERDTTRRRQRSIRCVGRAFRPRLRTVAFSNPRLRQAQGGAQMSLFAADLNFTTYDKPRVVKSYDAFEELFPAEFDIFARYDRQFSGAVLDVAIGA